MSEIPVSNHAKWQYIGDGVYVTFDGFQLILKTHRENDEHWIALGSTELDDLNRYADKTRGKKL